jgi:acetylornithine/succinyldiaminopimelate/putrescine aminotransferase
MARGRGLMQALVVAEPRRYPTTDLVQAAREQGLLVTRAGTDAVRLLPPLNASEDEVDHAIAILRQVADGIMRRRRKPVATVGAIPALAGTGGRT